MSSSLRIVKIFFKKRSLNYIKPNPNNNMTMSEYFDLIQQIVVTVSASDKHGQILHTLRDFYKDDIDSPRRFETITKISHLLNILEVRDVLSETDVGPLREIVRRLPKNKDLLQKLNEYEAAFIRGENIGHHVSEVTQNSSNKQSVESPFSVHPLANISVKKQQRINNTVIEEIGSYWRDLARNLEIREVTIDNIEDSNKTLAEKAAKLMGEYKSIADPDRWFFVLCNALERTRRKDLSQSIQNIMAMNI